jgi:cobaltochelatase CobS
MTSNDSKIACKICGAAVHSIQLHLGEKGPHVDQNGKPEWTLERYQKSFPDAPILSELAKRKLDEQRARQAAAPAPVAMAGATAAATATVTPISAAMTVTKAFHELFELGSVAAALSTKGGSIPVTVLSKHAWQDLVPAIDPNYVFDIDVLKNCCMARELNFPLYAWGHAGTGKTTIEEQIAARTNHPLYRLQHTLNTEESHVVGQWTVKGGETVFLPGPLPLAMRYGWIYQADEYDRAVAGVLSVYQPVLEGKSLVIKEATGTEWGIVKPHPNFRFFATGNSNGSGDETGLYQSTQMGDASNYDRFAVVVQVKYMTPELESEVVAKQAGINKADAKKLVDFAGRVREAYDANNVSATISPRTLINAAKLGVRRGSWRAGLALSFINKLSKVDRETVDGVAQRVFG